MFMLDTHKNKEILFYSIRLRLDIHPKLHFKGSVSKLTENVPKSHEQQHLKTNPIHLLNWANIIGVITVTRVRKTFVKVEHAPNIYSKLITVLSLAKVYGKYELDLAIGYTSFNNVINTASIKSILDKNHIYKVQ